MDVSLTIAFLEMYKYLKVQKYLLSKIKNPLISIKMRVTSKIDRALLKPLTLGSLTWDSSLGRIGSLGGDGGLSKMIF